MKKLFVLLFVLFSLQTLSQTNEKVEMATTPDYVYCELVGTQKFLSTKVVVSVDYGEEKEFFYDQRIRDEQTGKVQSFNSMVDALNYMGTKGWEFAQAYVVSTGSNSASVYHWLLKKKNN
jgi:hypothetical protein